MESLIKTFNMLQDVFTVIGEHKIDLPQIVIVGSQNSGKSSVLESLVCKSFLPQGVYRKIRAPLIIQMIRYNDREWKSMLEITQDETIKEWACFKHLPDKIFSNFNNVRLEIKRYTDVIAGNFRYNTFISEPIVLKVYTLLYDVTFIDLPEFPNAHQQSDYYNIYNNYLEYVKKENYYFSCDICKHRCIYFEWSKDCEECGSPRCKNYCCSNKIRYYRQ